MLLKAVAAVSVVHGAISRKRLAFPFPWTAAVTSKSTYRPDPKLSALLSRDPVFPGAFVKVMDPSDQELEAASKTSTPAPTLEQASPDVPEE